MENDERVVLTSDEASAFVAQWLSGKTIELDDLARRLEIDANQVESLIRQARGRVAMDKWTDSLSVTPERSPKKPIWTAVIPILGLVLAGIWFKTVQNHGPSQQPYFPPPRLHSGIQMTSGFGPPMGQSMGMPGPPIFEPSELALARQLGDTIGTEIAQSTMKGNPTGQSAKGGQVSSNNGPLFGKRASFRDVTKLVRSRQVVVPDDVVISIETPSVDYRIHGQETRDPQRAIRLRDVDLAEPLQSLMTFVLGHELVPGTLEPPASQSWAIVRIQIGRVQNAIPLHWSISERDQLASQFKEPSSPLNASLFSTILVGIQSAGSDLFHEVPVHSAQGPKISAHF